MFSVTHSSVGDAVVKATLFPHPQAHPYLVANGLGSGPAGFIAPTALASHPTAQAQMGAIQVAYRFVRRSVFLSVTRADFREIPF